jgi:hypothetical protein
MTVEAVINALARGGVRLTAAELADVLLVAANNTPAQRASLDDERPPPASDDQGKGLDPVPPADSPPDQPVRQIFDDQAASVAADSGGMPVHLPPGHAIPRRLETARSLRPFQAK